MQKFEQKYRIIEEIGRGAEGVCYKIEEIDSCKIYALKKIENKSQKSHCQQIDILSKLHHPNIVELMDSYDCPDATYLIMEYFPFSDLQKQIQLRYAKEQPFQEEEIFRYLRSMLLALEYMHGQGIVHRDVKPGNIMITADGQVKLADMGVAKHINDDACMSRVGTPYYLPPEIIRNQPYTYKADIWSLGCSIYYLAAFRHPFQAQNLISLGNKIMDDQIEGLEECSQDLNLVLREMLCKDPAWRPSAKTLLQRYFQEQGDKNKNEEDEPISKYHVKGQQDQIALNLASMSSNTKSESQEEEQFQNEDQVMELRRKSKKCQRIKIPIENKFDQVTIEEQDEVIILKASSNNMIGRSSKTLIHSYIALENGKIDPNRKTSTIHAHGRRPSIFKMISANAFTNPCPTPSQRNSMPLPDSNEDNSPNQIRMGTNAGVHPCKSKWASSNNLHRTSNRQDSAIMRKDKHTQIMKGLKKFKNAKIKKKDCENKGWEQIELLQPQLIIIRK